MYYVPHTFSKNSPFSGATYFAFEDSKRALVYGVSFTLKVVDGLSKTKLLAIQTVSQIRRERLPAHGNSRSHKPER